MENDNSTEKTAEFLKEFHKQNKRKTETHSEDLLKFCALGLAIFSIFECIITWISFKSDFIFAFAIGFGTFTAGVFFYVVAKICKLLIEIRDNLPPRS